MRLVLSIFLTILWIDVGAQDTQDLHFPADFLGVYKGMLKIDSPGGTNEIPMEFHLTGTKNSGVYNYVLVYGTGNERQERNYSLIEKDGDNGLYVVDENNGIILDDKVVENRMYSLFEVNDSLLTTFITFYSDHMVFEIVFAPRTKANVTYSAADSTRVISYPVNTVQRAVLEKEQ